MSELDLRLKADSRRLFWGMGFSTKVDVPLRAYVPVPKAGARGRSTHETFTDLDVLGIHISPDLRVQSAIADCKTTVRGSTERMFWIRGVADFFNADDAYMVRSGDVTAASRQLAARLGVAVLTPPDLATLESHYPSGTGTVDGTAEFLFDAAAMTTYRQALTSLDRKLLPLREYQEFDFWVYEEHRNLQQVVAHLGDAAKHFDPGHPAHRALFFELAWLYALSLARAVHHVRRTHLTEIETSLREYLVGGQVGLREKQALAAVLRAAAGKEQADGDDGVFPPYFAALLELSTRFVRRPTLASTVLRYAEWAAEAQIAKQDRPAAEVFVLYDDLAGKLLADICGFLVSAAKLDPEFRRHARGLFAPAQSANEPRTGTEVGRGTIATADDVATGESPAALPFPDAPPSKAPRTR